MEERSPSQLLAVTFPRVMYGPEVWSAEGGNITFSVTEGIGSINTTAGIGTLNSSGGKEMGERSPSQLLAVTLPLVLWIPPPLMREGISPSLLPEEQVRSTQLLEIWKF
jgi:hypothetical protein